MKTADIRQRFLDYFATRGHTIVPSAPLVYNDPTLLFVNAGMVPFKPYFTGAEDAPYDRAASVQKCVRTLDIDEVGKTTRHGTFFQMNGNFSFGDYFKEGAIEYAWELVTGSQADGNYGFDPDKVWVTVYLDDDEAFGAVAQGRASPTERIQRRGLKDNYWHMGIPGPGGPCSEIYIDRGPEYGPDGGPIVDEDRFLEIWNLVFQTEELSAVRAKDDFDVVRTAAGKNIDTGMGLERIAYLLQGVANMYEIDEIFPVISQGGRGRPAPATAPTRGRRPAARGRRPRALGADADDRRRHPRQRGARLRAAPAAAAQRPLDAAAGRARPGAARAAAGQPGPDVGVLPRRGQPVAAGLARSPTPRRRRSGARSRPARRSSTSLPARRARSTATEHHGDRAFALHDTYGFPFDLTLEMAAEQGLQVDQAGFRKLMQEQKDRAKADAKAKKGATVATEAYRTLRADGEVPFLGYTDLTADAKVRGIIADGQLVDRARPGRRGRGRARPDPVLRRVRRPGRRLRPDHR